MTPFLAELVGTGMLILLGNGVVANIELTDTKGHGSSWLALCIAWGFAVFVGVLISSPYSGAHLNPAVTLGLAIAGSFPWDQVASYMLAQLLGAMAGAIFVWLFYIQHYPLTEDKDAKKATFCTAPSIRHTFHNLFSEAIGAFALVFGVLFLTKPMVGEQAASLGSLDALPVGLLVLVIGLGLGGTTGYAINPARDLGPRIMHQLLPVSGKGDSDWKYSWIPIVGPFLGGILAACLYLILI